jgi:hypothetical protein
MINIGPERLDESPEKVMNCITIKALFNFEDISYEVSSFLPALNGT